MRAAPPVSVRCGGGPVWRAAQTATLALAGASTVYWALQWTQARGGMALSAGAVALPLMAWLCWRALREPDQRLVWDGQRWAVASGRDQVPDAPAQGGGRTPDVTIDLGHWMLLTVVPAPPRQRWCAVRRHGNEAAWGLFRAAVYARAPAPARVLSGAGPE